MNFQEEYSHIYSGVKKKCPVFIINVLADAAQCHHLREFFCTFSRNYRSQTVRKIGQWDALE